MVFELDGYDFLNKLGDEFELSDFGKPMLHAWKTVKGKFNPKAAGATKIPDITIWQTDLLVLNQKAYDLLKDNISSLGEFLPIEVGSDTYYLFNMLERLSDDVIDTNKSEYEYHATEEKPVGFKSLYFDENNIPQEKWIFCIQNDFAYNAYCDERLKNLIEENSLSGLYFNTTLIEPYFK